MEGHKRNLTLGVLGTLGKNMFKLEKFYITSKATKNKQHIPTKIIYLQNRR